MSRNSGFKCGECGKRFRSVRAAENAAFGDGCSRCGSTDVIEDMGDMKLSQMSPGVAVDELRLRETDRRMTEEE